MIPFARSSAPRNALRWLAPALLFLLLFVSLTPLAAQDATEAPAFPVKIQHKFGSITLTQAPQRIVSIGFTDQDPLLALGVTPVAVRYWYGDEKDAIFPWAKDKVAGEPPVVLSMDFGSLNFEAILALKPDLIVALYSGITQEEYDLLTSIAPTLAQTDDYIDFGLPWQNATRMIGAALGQSAEAETLVANLEAKIRTASMDNPAFAGKNVAVVYGYKAGSYGFYTAEDSRARFFTDLGFVVPEELTEIAGKAFYADVSNETLSLLDRDLIVFVGLQFIEGGRDAVQADPLFAGLKASQEGRVLYVSDDSDDALQFSTVLSIPYALDHIVPQLDATVGGAESTVTPEVTPAATAE